jgi:tetratricopeptide (TPR) repeat protein
MSAAAVLLLLLIPAYFMFFYESSTNKLFNQYYQPPTNKLTDQPRGGSAENQELKAMMNAYENSEYKVALKQANEYLERNNAKTNQLIFYRGIMHLELDNHQKALQDFRAFKNQDEKYRDKALWYLALTHLASRKKDQARNILLQLQERPPSRFTQKAEALLAEME